ncbi:MAG: hypothetical protein ACRED0_07125 [Gammaproteobacteria bacterium]
MLTISDNNMKADRLMAAGHQAWNSGYKTAAYTYIPAQHHTGNVLGKWGGVGGLGTPVEDLYIRKTTFQIDVQIFA